MLLSGVTKHTTLSVYIYTPNWTTELFKVTEVKITKPVVKRHIKRHNKTEIMEY